MKAREGGRFAAVDVERPRSCPHGHEMTAENTRVRWIRNRAYPLRECRTCIKAKAKAHRATPEAREYHAKYQRDHYVYGGKHATREHVPAAPKKIIPLSDEEKFAAEARWADKDGLYAEHISRIAARFNRRSGWRVAREKLVMESMQADQAAELAIASALDDDGNPINAELVKLMKEQALDAANFIIKRPPVFVPQARADALLYGTVYAFELS